MERSNWRLHFNSLREIFPQVDVRLLKGAVMEHGDNLDAAADYIMTECMPDEIPLQVTRRRQRQEAQTVYEEGNATRPVVDAYVMPTVPVVHATPATVPVVDEHLNSAPNIQKVACSSQLISSGEMVQSTIVVTHSDSKELAAATLLSRQSGSLPGACLGEVVVTSSRHGDVVESKGVYLDEAASSVPSEETEVDNAYGAEGSGDRSQASGSNALELSQYSTQSVSTSSSRGEVMSKNRTDSLGLGHRCGLAPLEEWKEKPVIAGQSVTDTGVASDLMRIGEHPAIEVPNTGSPESDLHGKDIAALHLSSMSSRLNTNDVESLRDVVSAARAEKEELDMKLAGVRQLFDELVTAETRAKESKARAARAGEDIHNQVAKMQQMLLLAQEANEKRADDINAEKGVLATEARELRSRLLRVEADKIAAGAALEEVQAVLKAKIDAFRIEEEAAEDEYIKKTELAKDLLRIEEAKLSHVVAYANELEQDDQSCTRMREFLDTSGRTVDSLQAEVQALVENVENLKVQVEGAVLSNSGYVTMMGILPRAEGSARSMTNCSARSFASSRSWNGEAQLEVGSACSELSGSSTGKPLLGGFRMALSSSQMVNSSIAGSSHSVCGPERLLEDLPPGSLEMFCDSPRPLEESLSGKEPTAYIEENEMQSVSVSLVTPSPAYAAEGMFTVGQVTSAQLSLPVIEAGQLSLPVQRSEEKSAEEAMYEAHVQMKVLPAEPSRGLNQPSVFQRMGAVRRVATPNDDWELVDDKGGSSSSLSSRSAESCGPPDVWMGNIGEGTTASYNAMG